MTHDFTGPHPEKRLDDMLALASGYIAAQNAVDAWQYPDSIEDNWQSHELAEALDGLEGCAMRDHKIGFGEVSYCFESAAKTQAVQKAIAILLNAVRHGVIPTPEDHRLVVVTMGSNWSFGYRVSFEHMDHNHWPQSVIPATERAFAMQTQEVVEAWQTKLDRKAARIAGAREEALGVMGWLNPVVAGSKLASLRSATHQ